MEIDIDLLVYEGVVGSELRPGAAGDAGELDEAPVDGGFIRDAEEVAGGWGDVDAGPLVVFIFRAFIAENVFPVVGDEGPAVLPLGVADLASAGAVDLHPAALADALAGFAGDAVPPRDDAGGFGLMCLMIDTVVVGEGDVKGVLSRSESGGEVAGAGLAVWVVVAAEVFLPILVPR